MGTGAAMAGTRTSQVSFTLSIIIIIVQLETLVSLLLLLIFLDRSLVINNERGMEFEMTEKKELSPDALY